MSQQELADKAFQSTLPVRGATGKQIAQAAVSIRFQSTLPVRGATTGQRMQAVPRGDFNPRSP